MNIYLGGNQPSSPEEGKKHKSEYMAWLSSLGDSAISPVNPKKNTSIVNLDRSVTSGSITSMSSFTVIEADSMEEALSIEKIVHFLI